MGGRSGSIIPDFGGCGCLRLEHALPELRRCPDIQTGESRMFWLVVCGHGTRKLPSPAMHDACTCTAACPAHDEYIGAQSHIALTCSSASTTTCIWPRIGCMIGRRQ